jgi:hypothetical protein
LPVQDAGDFSRGIFRTVWEWTKDHGVTLSAPAQSGHFRRSAKMADLSERQWQAMQAARQAMRDVLRRAYPEDFERLWASAIASDFADICRTSLHQRELIDVINSHLCDFGLELRRVRRN